MPRECTICKHESRHEIDSALVSGIASIRTVSQQYGVSKDALTRHVRSGHIAKKIQKAQIARDAVEAENLLSRIQKHQDRFDKLIERVQKTGDIDWELKVLHGLKEYLDLEGKATGAFREKIEHSGGLTIANKMSDEEVERRALAILAKRRK
jgi:hypothetical protein